MRWSLVVALAAVAALLGWLVVAERERDVRERQALTETKTRRALAPAEKTADARRAQQDEPKPVAFLEGTVSGCHGGIWGVRIAVFEAGADEVLAERYTDTEGRYSLELAPGAVVDVLADPADETGLEDRRRREVAVPAVVDFVFGYQTLATGRLRCVGWTRNTGIRVVAVPEAGYAATAPPVDLPAAATTRVSLREDEGRFEFVGLPPGAYRLALNSSEWMLHGPVRFTADTKDIEAVAVRAFGLSLRVEDAARGVPVGRFRVDTHFDERTVVTWEGRAGELWRRVAHPMPLDWHRDWRNPGKGFLTISALGYAGERRPLGFSGRVRLRPTGEANVFLEARHTDGGGCAEPLRAFALRDGVDAFDLGLERAPDGRWRAWLPPGRWTVRVAREQAVIQRPRSLELEVPADGQVEREVAFERPGTLILRGEVGRTIWLAGLDEDRSASFRMALVLESVGHECRLPPGRYVVFDDAAATRRVASVEVNAGDRISVDVPVRDR